jgi:hypothetical protein
LSEEIGLDFTREENFPIETAMLRIRRIILSQQSRITVNKSLCTNQRYQEPFQGGERNFWKLEAKEIPPVPPPKRYIRKAFSIFFAVITSLLVSQSLLLGYKLEKNPEIIEILQEPEVFNDSKTLIFSLSQLYLDDDEKNIIMRMTDEDFKRVHFQSMAIVVQLLYPSRCILRLFGVKPSENPQLKPEVISILNKINQQILDEIKKKNSHRTF